MRDGNRPVEPMPWIRAVVFMIELSLTAVAAESAGRTFDRHSDMQSDIVRGAADKQVVVLRPHYISVLRCIPEAESLSGNVLGDSSRLPLGQVQPGEAQRDSLGCAVAG